MAVSAPSSTNILHRCIVVAANDAEISAVAANVVPSAVVPFISEALAIRTPILFAVAVPESQSIATVENQKPPQASWNERAIVAQKFLPAFH